MDIDWRRTLHEKYRKKFGCKNIGEVCWCPICVNVEKLINEVVKNVKENIPDE
jgi:hypothetical protein